jgi:hypothetical protein
VQGKEHGNGAWGGFRAKKDFGKTKNSSIGFTGSIGLFLTGTFSL